ncbi:hypothetical protein Tco_0699786 [Tanacetum coccineum]
MSRGWPPPATRPRDASIRCTTCLLPPPPGGWARGGLSASRTVEPLRSGWRNKALIVESGVPRGDIRSLLPNSILTAVPYTMNSVFMETNTRRIETSTRLEVPSSKKPRRKGSNVVHKTSGQSTSQGDHLVKKRKAWLLTLCG